MGIGHRGKGKISTLPIAHCPLPQFFLFRTAIGEQLANSNYPQNLRSLFPGALFDQILTIKRLIFSILSEITKPPVYLRID